jgi:addiction module HigA family antidote
MYNPAHPGEVLLEMHLKPLGITITEAAERLGISRQMLSSICHGKAPVSVDVARRLAAATSTSIDLWLGMQAQFNAWQANRRPLPKVKSLLSA